MYPCDKVNIHVAIGLLVVEGQLQEKEDKEKNQSGVYWGPRGSRGHGPIFYTSPGTYMGILERSFKNICNLLYDTSSSEIEVMRS